MKVKLTGIIVLALLLGSVFALPFSMALSYENPISVVPRDIEYDADLNNDGFVDERDLTIVLDNWGYCNKPYKVPIASAKADMSCRGDIDGDRIVGVNDLLIVLANWDPRPSSDLNGDGVVDRKDLKILLNAWGKCNSTLTSTQVRDYCRADLNRDGIVNVEDLLILLGDWTHTRATETPSKLTDARRPTLVDVAPYVNNVDDKLDDYAKRKALYVRPASLTAVN